jgi:hypothetical protein
MLLVKCMVGDYLFITNTTIRKSMDSERDGMAGYKTYYQNRLFRKKKTTRERWPYGQKTRIENFLVIATKEFFYFLARTPFLTRLTSVPLFL